MGSKQLQVKNWHLTKMDWEQKMGNKKIKKKMALQKKESDGQNRKQTAPEEKLASDKNGVGRNMGSKKIKQNGTLEKGIGPQKGEANSSKEKTGILQEWTETKQWQAQK